MRLEDLLTSAGGFGLESASFLQRCFCRVTDGQPLDDLLSRGSDYDRRCFETALGCSAADVPTGSPPTEIVDLEPVRTGKSLRLAALAVARSQTIDVSIVKPGEEGPRISLLATQLDNASAIRGHLNIVNERPALRSLKIGEDSDSITLRHPSGVPVEIRVIAAQRGGYSLASRWSGTTVFDEAPGWHSTDRIVSLEESREQALGRLLPGAQAYYAGSKWQPAGYCFKCHAEHFGKPTRDLVVISPQAVDGVSPAQQLNPVYWTPERIAKVAKASPRTATMHVENNFGGAENSLLSKGELDECISETIPEGYVFFEWMVAVDSSALRRDGFRWIAACFLHPDPTPRQKWVSVNGIRDAYPLRDQYGTIVCHPIPDRTLLRIAHVGGVEGDELHHARIEGVIDRLASFCRRFGVRDVYADHFEQTALAGLAAQRGLLWHPYQWSEQSKMDAIGGTLKRYVRDREISITPHEELIRELLSIREVPRPGNKWGYETGGLDVASAVISLMHALNDPDRVGVNLHRGHRMQGVPHAGGGSRKHIINGR